VGCGGFVLGFLILASVLGVVLLFSTGMLDGIFAAGSGAVARPSPLPGITPSVTSEPPTAGPSPTPTATPQPLVTVPSIAGLPESDARGQLLSVGLIPVSGGFNSHELVPVGSVISQTVLAGSQLVQGQPVTYTISTGPASLTLASFVQTRIDRAQARLEELGLQVEIVEQASTSVSANFIIGQDPAPGALVQPGDVVRLIVSKGDQVRVPALKGLSEEEAIARIQSVGLFHSYSDPQGRDKLGPLFDQVAPGTVVSSDPGEGEWTPRGSGVTIGVRAP
jgi:serine/threonine-protein kinase